MNTTATGKRVIRSGGADSKNRHAFRTGFMSVPAVKLDCQFLQLVHSDQNDNLVLVTSFDTLHLFSLAVRGGAVFRNETQIMA